MMTGARQVGKTTLLQNLFEGNENVLWLNADETSVRDRLSIHEVANLERITGNYKIIIIDEVQRIENAGILLKLFADHFKDVQVIATGSSALDISDQIFEPLTGRHLLYHLFPFTLAEMYSGKSEFEISQKLPFHLVFGNYPDIFNFPRDAETLLSNLANQYLYKDVLSWKNIRKPEILEKLLKLLSFQVCSEVSVHELSKKLKIKSETVESYLYLLEKSFVIFRLRSFSTNERKEVTKMSKVYFWDNGIRNAVIGNYEDTGLRNDRGVLWENFVISERMKMNAWLYPNIKSYFWRNYNQSEVDYVELYKGETAAFEMKYSGGKKHKVSKAFQNMYPNATTEVITSESFGSFCRVNEHPLKRER